MSPEQQHTLRNRRCLEREHRAHSVLPFTGEGPIAGKGQISKWRLRCPVAANRDKSMECHFYGHQKSMP